MTIIKRYPAQLLLGVGAILVIQSVAWEYVRVHPKYRFIVDPWSLRGYELTQGRVIMVLGVGLLILGILTFSRLDLRFGRGPGYVISGLVVAAAVAIAAVVNPDIADVSVNAIGGIIISLVLGYVLTVLSRDLLAPRFRRAPGYTALGVFVVSTLVFYFAILSPLLVDEPRSIGLPVVLLVTLIVLFLPALVVPPAELALNRVLILSIALSWVVQVLSSGAVRSTLLRHQLEAGAAAQYKDVQITSGMMLAFLGFALAFVGAVVGWAQRRDQLVAQRRAREQREAAEKSMAELHAAADATKVPS